MKVALPKDGDMLNQQFGQSKEFLIATIENQKVMDTKVVSTDNLQQNHDELTNLLVNEGVTMVILGGIGQPALQALQDNGLSVITGVSGTYEEILQAYLRGDITDPNFSYRHH